MLLLAFHFLAFLDANSFVAVLSCSLRLVPESLSFRNKTLCRTFIMCTVFYISFPCLLSTLSHFLLSFLLGQFKACILYLPLPLVCKLSVYDVCPCGSVRVIFVMFKALLAEISTYPSSCKSPSLQCSLATFLLSHRMLTLPENAHTSKLTFDSKN
jgi:hypothetical protein